MADKIVGKLANWHKANGRGWHRARWQKTGTYLPNGRLPNGDPTEPELTIYYCEKCLLTVAAPQQPNQQQLRQERQLQEKLGKIRAEQVEKEESRDTRRTG